MKNKKMGYALVIIGVLLVGVGVWMVCASRTATIEESVATHELVTDQKDTDANLNEIDDNNTDNDLTESEEKGRAFEEYVVSHFNKKYFTLKEWRGDKYYEGNYAESNRYPDMEYEFSLDGKTVPFAVECKWRNKFNNEWITWATEEQADIYRKFEKDSDMPVFVVIGVGGTPSEPEQVYAVPLRVLKMNIAKKDYIHDFMREDKEKNFYLDIENMLLR